MGKIYRDYPEIPIPAEGHIKRSDGRVYIIEKLNGKPRKHVMIGKATSETMMYPNSNFQFLYPNEWKNAYGEEKTKPHELHCGMYAASLGIGYETGLYPLMISTFGGKTGNEIMDFILFTIINHTNALIHFQTKMSDHLLYSEKALSDSSYSNLFSNNLSADDVHRFKIAWLEECVKNNITKVWLSIDGSNSDCNIEDSDLCEKGKNKSHTNSDIVSYIWAINVEDGMPVTYFVNNGGMVDSKAFDEVITFLHHSNIEIAGVIIDRGFACHSVISSLNEKNIPYVMMLKSSHNGHKEMMNEYAEMIFWRMSYIINRNGIFGVRDKKQLFSTYPEEAYVSLFFDCINATSRSVTHINKIFDALYDAEQAIKNNEIPEIPKKYQNIIEIENTPDGSKVVLKYQEWQKVIYTKGFYSIASSEDLSPDIIHQIYFLRDCSEKQYMIMKSHMGFDSPNAKKDSSLENKFFICFAAAILRSKFMNACKLLKLDTNEMISKLDRISLVLMPNGTYTSVNNLSDNQLELLKEFGIKQSDFKTFSIDVNSRYDNPIYSLQHRLPEDPKRFTNRKVGRPAKKKEQTEDAVIKRGRGRPKGSKNKKTLEREAKMTGEDNQPKRSPGRPKGSRNKKTLERERRKRNKEPEIKRKPGRPLGSKNKPKVKRGRPLGSKNKPKENQTSEQ